MPFIPHTDDDTREMLETIGAKSLDDLFDEIPKDLLIDSLDGDRVGLVLFGSVAFVQAPFPADLEVVTELLDEAQVRMLGPRTMLGDAIGKAVQVFDASELDDKVLLLLTDCNDTGECHYRRADYRRSGHVAGWSSPPCACAGRRGSTVSCSMCTRRLSARSTLNRILPITTRSPRLGK